MTSKLAPGQSHFALLRRSGFQGPLAEVSEARPDRTKPNGRRAARDAAIGRQKWIAYYSPLVQLLAQKELAKELAKPTYEEKLKENPAWVFVKGECQDQEHIERFKDAACFTPFVRKEPKIRHQRGMLRRLVKRLKDETLELPAQFPVEYIPPPAPETVEGQITGPK